MPVPSPRSSAVTHAQDVRRLRDLLRAAISGARFPDGRLPGERELMVGHAASRSTVREALGLLAAEGLLRGSAGAYEVAAPVLVAAGRAPLPPDPHAPLDPHARLDPHAPVDPHAPPGPPDPHGLSDLHADAGYAGPPSLRAVDPSIRPVGIQVLDRSGLAAPGPLAAWLGIAPGSPCLRIEFLTLSHGVPSAVETHYVVHPEAGDLIGIPLRGSWETLLDDAGLRRGRTDRWGGRIPADPAVAELLGVATGSDLVAVEQTTCDPSGRVFDGAVLRIRSDAPATGTHHPAAS